MKDLNNKTALVTGAASGIGFAFARQLAAAGARVVATDINLTALQDAASSLPENTLTIEHDVTSFADWQRVAEKLAAEGIEIDVLINNAGISSDGKDILDTDPEEYALVIDTNLASVFYGVRTFGPAMRSREDGHIVNVASMAGMISAPSIGVYAASKFGVVGLTETLKDELEPHNVGVTVFCPGFVKTNIANNVAERTGVAVGNDFIARGMEVDAAVSVAVQGIKNRWAYAFSHPNYQLEVQTRMEAILDGFHKHSLDH